MTFSLRLIEVAMALFAAYANHHHQADARD